MTICFLTQYYPPEIGAPQARLSEMVNIFKKNGFDVTILTAMPNYPTGKIYRGYGGFYRKEKINDVMIHRCYIYATKSVGFVKRLANYFSFVISSLIIGFIKLPKLDILITENPPLFLGISGFILSKIKRARWIFNVSDLWPDSAIELGVLNNKSLIKIAYKLESFCYKNAWIVTGQSKEIINSINTRFPGLSTYHLSNGVDVQKFRPDKYSPRIHKQMTHNYRCVFLYAGLHGIAQGLDQILLANAKIENPDFKIVLVGDGPVKQDLISLNLKLNMGNVEFKDPVQRDKVPELVASADIAFIPLKQHLQGAVPSKLYEAMSSGIAVIIIDDGEAAEIVSNNKCGVVVQPGDLDALANVMVMLSGDDGLRKKYGQAGRKTAQQLFSRTKIVNEFLSRLSNKSYS